MRVALFEIAHREEIPVAVSIDEAVDADPPLLRHRSARLRQRSARGHRRGVGARGGAR